MAKQTRTPRRRVRRYFRSESGFITATQLRRAKPEIQHEVMSTWFKKHYTNPIDNSPVEHGSYIFIWGGPYDPHQELMSEFGDIVPDEIIKELASELQEIAFEWTGDPDEQDGDDLPLDFGKLFGERLGNFHDGIDKTERLLSTPVEDELKPTFLRLLFANVITTLETYLASFFISKVNEDTELFRKLLENDTDFQKLQIRLSDVYNQEKITRDVNAHLAGMMWHNLPKAKELFNRVLGMPLDIAGELFKAVLVRHDIIHRNGRTRDGSERSVTEQNVRSLISVSSSLAHQIDEKWNARNQGPAIIPDLPDIESII